MASVEETHRACLEIRDEQNRVIDYLSINLSAYEKNYKLLHQEFDDLNVRLVNMIFVINDIHYKILIKLRNLKKLSLKFASGKECLDQFNYFLKFKRRKIEESE